jgi:hypothetical protein
MYFLDAHKKRKALFEEQRNTVLNSFKAFVMTFAPIADKSIPNRVVTNYSMRTVIDAIDHALKGLIHSMNKVHALKDANGGLLFNNDGEVMYNGLEKEGCSYCKTPNLIPILDENGKVISLKFDGAVASRVHMLNIAAPQRSLKSVINACAVMFLWAHVPEARIIYLTDNDKVRLNHNVYCNNIFASQLYFKYTGLKRPNYATNAQINRAMEDGDEISPDAFNNEFTTSNEKGGIRSTYRFITDSIGTSYNLILLDDILSINSAMAGDFTVKMAKYEEMLKFWLTRHVTYDTCLKLCNTQRYSINDAFVWLDKRGALPVVIPYEKTERDYDNFIVKDRRAVGDPAIPHSLITPQQIAELRIVSPKAYYANMQQDPVPNEGNVFGEDCFVYEDIGGVCEKYCIAFDTANKALSTSAQTAAVIFARSGRHIVIIDYFAGQFRLDEVVDKFNEYATLYPSIKQDVVIEDQSTGSALRDMLVRSCGVRSSNVTMAKTLGLSKKMRAEEIEPEMRNGTVRFHCDMNPAQKERLQSALLTFSGTGDCVDLVDAFVHGVKKLTNKPISHRVVL